MHNIIASCRNNFLRKMYESTSLASPPIPRERRVWWLWLVLRARILARPISFVVFAKLPIATLRITRLQSTENNLRNRANKMTIDADDVERMIAEAASLYGWLSVKTARQRSFEDKVFFSNSTNAHRWYDTMRGLLHVPKILRARGLLLKQ